MDFIKMNNSNVNYGKVAMEKGAKDAAKEVGLEQLKLKKRVPRQVGDRNDEQNPEPLPSRFADVEEVTPSAMDFGAQVGRGRR